MVSVPTKRDLVYRSDLAVDRDIDARRQQVESVIGQAHVEVAGPIQTPRASASR